MLFDAGWIGSAMQEPENQSPPARHEAQPGAPAAIRGNPWAYPVMWIVVVLTLAGSGVYVFHSCVSLPGRTLDRSADLAVKIGQALEKVAAAFNQGTITTTFTSYATTLKGSQYFQFATLSEHEVFTRKDQASTAFGYVPLPDVIVEASAPVTYTYYLDLADHWEFLLQNGVIYVTAPDIKFNKPAVDASRIEYEVKKNSMIRNTTEAMQNLKDSITWMSIEKARANVDLVREKARRQTELFVQNWLSRSFSDGKDYPVRVRFRSEAPTNGISTVAKPG